MNYYDELKETYISDKKYNSANLFTDNMVFLSKKMGVKVLLFALALSFLQIIPLILSDNLLNLTREGLTTGISGLYINLGNRFGIFSLLLDIASTIISSYFIMQYFLKSKNFKLSISELFSQFKSGILKNLALFFIALIVIFILTFIAGFFLMGLGRFGVILFFLTSMALTVFFQVFTISIFDDTRVRFGDAWDRATTVFRTKEFISKFLFYFLLNFLVIFTISNIIFIVPRDYRLVAAIIGQFVLVLYQLISTGFLITSFIFVSDYVKYYLPPSYAKDYGYDSSEDLLKYDE